MQFFLKANNTSKYYNFTHVSYLIDSITKSIYNVPINNHILDTTKSSNHIPDTSTHTATR